MVEPMIRALAGTSLAVVVAFAVTRLARKAPAQLRDAFWRTALAAIWLVPLGIVAFRLTPAAQPAVTVHLPAPAAGKASKARTQPAVSPLFRTAPSGRQRLEALARRVDSWGLSPGAILALLWIAGILVGVVRYVCDVTAAKRLLEVCEPVTDSQLQRTVTDYARELGLRTAPALAETTEVGVPFVLNARSPILVVPPGFGLGEGGEPALVHELAHVRRRDLIVRGLARMARVLWWWNPLVWLTERWLLRTAEEVCDDWAIAVTRQRKPYAELLVRWADRGLTSPAAFARPGEELIRRVHRIVSETGAPAVRLSPPARVMMGGFAALLIVSTGIVRVTAATAVEGPVKIEKPPENVRFGQVVLSFRAPCDSPYGIAKRPRADSLIISCYESHLIMEISAKDGSRRAVANAQLEPVGLAFAKGELWICDDHMGPNGTLYAYGPKNQIQLPPAPHGSRGITWDGKAFWIAQPGSGLVRMDMNGKVLDRRSAPFPLGSSVAYDPVTGNLWVADARYDFQQQGPHGERNQVHELRLNDDGTVTLLRAFPAPGDAASGMCVDGPYLWIANSWSDSVYKVWIREQRRTSPATGRNSMNRRRPVTPVFALAPRRDDHAASRH